MLSEAFIYKFIKFCVVGFSGVFVDFGITWLLKEKLLANKYFANSCGFVVAATSNYFLNRLWTFHSHNQQIATEYFSFFFISMAGLGIANLLIYIANDRLKINFYIAKLLAIGMVTLWNFIMNYWFTFR